MSAAAVPSHLTVGEVARRFGVRGWYVRRLCERGLIPEPGRAGRYRVFLAEDLPHVEAALRAAGYLPSNVASPAGGAA